MFRNDRIERAILFKSLIKQQDRPCVKCGSRDRREIAHIVPYYLGGETSEANCRVLCRSCNLSEHHASKFLIGDKIVLNGRTPASIDLARHRPRTIIDIKYNSQRRCNYYKLGSNGRGACADGQPLEGYDYKFRSYMMLPYTPRQYHFKRHYKRVQSSIISCDIQQGGQTDRGIVGCLDKPKTSLDL